MIVRIVHLSSFDRHAAGAARPVSSHRMGRLTSRNAQAHLCDNKWKNPMLAENQLPNNPSLTLISRVLFTSLFFLSGVTHFTNIPYYQSLMPDVVPYPVFWILISGVVELIGAAMILFNWRPRLGGWLIILFMIPVTIVVHGYEMLHAANEAMRANQQAHFLKGFALMGAALLITQLGVAHRTAPQPA